MTSAELKKLSIEESVDYLQDRVIFLHTKLDQIIKMQGDIIDVCKKEQDHRKKQDEAIHNLTLMSTALFEIIRNMES